MASTLTGRLDATPLRLTQSSTILREPCFIRGAVGGGPSGTLMAMEPAGDSA